MSHRGAPGSATRLALAALLALSCGASSLPPEGASTGVDAAASPDLASSVETGAGPAEADADGRGKIDGPAVLPDAATPDLGADASPGAPSQPDAAGPEAGADAGGADALPPPFVDSCQRACAMAAPLQCPLSPACVPNCVFDSERVVGPTSRCQVPLEAFLACAASRPLADWECGPDGAEQLMSGICTAEAITAATCIMTPTGP